MASKAALVLALACCAQAADPINPVKYNEVAEAGACRGNGGAAANDKVNSKYMDGLTQTECEAECDSVATCVGYAYQTGNTDLATRTCLIHGPGVAGSCSNSFQDTKEKCAAVGTCSDASVDACGLTEGSNCLGIELACTNTGGVWTSLGSTWTEPTGGWLGDSWATTHIDGGNGNSDYDCYDIDIDDHEATCVNGPTHAGYNVHAGANTALSGTRGECAATWSDGYSAACDNQVGCPATACDGDTLGSWCCEEATGCVNWHYCGCERDFEAGGKLETACDVAAGCVYTAAPVMETEVMPNPGDSVHCDNVYQPGILGACRATDPATGGQVGVNGKSTKTCDMNGILRTDCGGTGQPTCAVTQAICQANCAAENAIAPGRCQAYHWMDGGWCTLHGPDIDTSGLGWDAVAGTAAADSCWSFSTSTFTEVDSANTNIYYMCYMLIDPTVNSICAYPTDGASAATLAFGAALAAGLLA